MEAAGIEGAARYGPAWPQMELAPVQTCPTGTAGLRGHVQGQAAAFGITIMDSAFSAAGFASSASEMTPASASEFKMYCRRFAARSGCASGFRPVGFCTSPTRNAAWAVVSTDTGHP